MAKGPPYMIRHHSDIVITILCGTQGICSAQLGRSGRHLETDRSFRSGRRRERFLVRWQVRSDCHEQLLATEDGDRFRRDPEEMKETALEIWLASP